MATFKIKATAMVEIEKEIEASSKEEAESIFYDDTYSNIVEDADSSGIYDISTDCVETLEMDYKVHIHDISYDIDEEDENPDLPNELTLWVECDGEKDDADFDDIVNDAIEDETGWCVKNFKYEVLETR